MYYDVTEAVREEGMFVEGAEGGQQVRHFLLKPLLRSLLQEGLLPGHQRGWQGEEDEEIRVVAEESSVVAQVVGVTTRIFVPRTYEINSEICFSIKELLRN